ncbi:acyl carrier protein [Bordetella genomosp. 12]|uniref:Acyl carrier protein n=1 Tax=Bordetella genomosp. 12 TaxID=463035 RepID=A0A261VTF0_9BORD|nr:acyl carrier protein [Bordetella genomosp. 12]OZI77388.1 acyl carrier protein [Bordetella genomosp. 12]
MQKPSLEAFIESFLTACDFVQEVRVTGDTRFDEMADFDSLAMLGVIIMMEAEFGRPVTADKIFALGSVAALHAYAQGEQ